MTSLDSERSAQCKDGVNPAPVELIVRSISTCFSMQEAKPLFDVLETEANKLGWRSDRDFAAVALQHYSTSAAAEEVRLGMLSMAARRAARCASCATCARESLARSAHLKELEALLEGEMLPVER